MAANATAFAGEIVAACAGAIAPPCHSLHKSLCWSKPFQAAGFDLAILTLDVYI